MAQGQVTTPNHKVRKRVNRKAEDVITVANVHEALVSKNDFETVQRLLSVDMRRPPGKDTVYPLSGLCFCADCGAPMTRKATSTGFHKYNYYVCSENKRSRGCTPHRIREETLLYRVTETLRGILAVMPDLDGLAERIAGTAGEDAAGKRSAALQKQNDDELERCEAMLMSLYEDLRAGIVDEKDFAVIKKRITERRAAAEQAATALRREEADGRDRQEHLRLQAEEFMKYGRIRDFDRAALVSLVRMVKVSEDGNIDMVLNCDDELGRILKQDTGNPGRAVSGRESGVV